MKKLQKGDIVQVTDMEDEWFPCLLIIDEVKAWGIQGYVSVPGSGTAYYRIANGKFEKVGTATIVME